MPGYFIMAVDGEGSRFTVVCDNDHLDASGAPEVVTRISEATAHKIEATARKIGASALKTEVRGSRVSTKRLTSLGTRG